MLKEISDLPIGRIAHETMSQRVYGDLRELIMSGRVRRGTERFDKPGKELPPDTPLEVEPSPRFVSRGGEKLAAALNRFALEVRGAHVLDVGASTGGFTDCVLQAGAAEVHLFCRRTEPMIIQPYRWLTFAGEVTPSSSSTPIRSLCNALSDKRGEPRSITKYSFSTP